MGITLDSIKDKTLGKTFGKLTVLKYIGRSELGDNLWRCECSCGRKIVGRTSNITKPTSACKSCKVADGPRAQKAKTHLIDKVFNRLTVIEHGGKNKYGQYLWKCQCSCGNEIIARGSDLLTGVTGSCGCYGRDRASETSRTHGLHKHPLYAVWYAMKGRCYNPKDARYIRYGGRGISICDEWQDDFRAFYAWSIAKGYETNLTIERENNDGNYEPGNCKWANRSEQMQNTSLTKITSVQVPIIRNDPRSHSDIATDYGVDESTISRIKMRRTWKNIP